MNGTCPFCESSLEDNPHWIVRDHLRIVPGSFAFHSCPGCGSAALKPIPSLQVLQASYPDRYTFSANRERGRNWKLLGRCEMAVFYRSMYRRDAALLRDLVPERNTKLLDVGTGGGQRAALFRELGFRVEGLETSPAAARSAREALNMTVHEDLIEEFSRKNEGKYGILTMYNVLEHFQDASSATASARALLGKSGWLILKVPACDGFSISILGRRYIAIQEAPRHVALPSRRGIRILLTRSGFEIIRIQPASLVSRAGLIGLSLVPAGAYASAARSSLPRYLAIRVLAALAALLVGIPVVLIESFLGRPSAILVAARKTT